jgi:hypothetical protein
MSYQKERDQFVARMAAEGLPLWATEQLLRAATGIQRRAELACSSEAADRDRVPCPALRNTTTHQIINQKFPCLCDYDHEAKQHGDVTRIALQDWRAEERLRKMFKEINSPRMQAAEYTDGDLWQLETQGDPRGYCLRVIPPSYADRNRDRDRLNRDTIGVPARDSRLRF